MKARKNQGRRNEKEEDLRNAKRRRYGICHSYLSTKNNIDYPFHGNNQKIHQYLHFKVKEGDLM